MIKLFRNIRKNLLDTGKTTRYFKYAIGEIILVVFGILIALQVNNWNLANKERTQEIKYLKSLKVDLETDIVNLDKVMDDRLKKVSSAVALLSSSPPKSVDQIKVIDSLKEDVFVWSSFTPRTNTLDEMISSGYINKITADSIKFYLLSVIEKNEKLTLHREHMRHEYDHYLYDRSMPILEINPFLNFDSFLQRKFIPNVLSQKDEAQVIAQVTTFIEDMVIRNGLKLAVRNNLSLHLSCISLKSEIEKLIPFINEDID